jgi:Rnl2 family RNA ligase
MIKYPKITNHYNVNTENLESTEYFPELLFVVHEKIHGANIQFIFDHEGNFSSVASRNRVLDVNESFYGVWNVIERMEKEGFFFRMKDYISRIISLNPGDTVNLFGELYGGNIQSGVWYGEEQSIRFFDIIIAGEIWSQDLFMTIFHNAIPDFERYIVPVFKDALFTLDEVLDLDVNVNSILTPSGYDKENICEGVVAKPYFKVIQDKYGSILYIKKKNEKFKERSKTKKKVDIEVNSNVVRLMEDFASYINTNRLDSVFSKEGPISDISELGKYLKLIMEDAREDFLNEVSDNDRIFVGDKSTLKKILSSGNKLAVKLLKEYMQGR